MIWKRLLTGWTYVRIAYLIIGLLVIGQSIAEEQWLGLALGGYISFMGLFAFGCAAGSCFDGSCSVEPDNNHKK